MECCIARLGQELSTSFAQQFEDLSFFFLRTSFNQRSQDVTTKIASNNASLTAPPEVSVTYRPLGQQPSPHPPVATVGHHREFQVQGGVDREPSMTIQPPPSGESVARGSVLGEQVQVSQCRLEFSAPPSGSAQQQVTFDSAASHVRSEEVEDDEDDADSITASAVDHSFVRLSKFIYDQYPESRPLSSPSLPPRCSFESLFAPVEPPESSCPHLRLYPRVQEVMTATRELAAALSRKMKPFSAVLPKKNRKHSIADVPEFSTAPLVNSNFSHLTDNKTVSNKRWGSITFLEMDRMESVSRSLLEGISHSLWLLSGILSQLKQADFSPPDPDLFNTNISSISASLSSQARSAAALADFLQSKWRESYVAHTTLPLSQAQKCELLVSPGSSSGIFDQSLLEISSQVKEDSFISSSLSMAKMIQSRPFGGVSHLPHRPVLQVPLLWLALQVTSHLFFNVPPLTSAPPLLTEVAVLSALRGGGGRVGLLRNPVGVLGSRSHIPVLP